MQNSTENINIKDSICDQLVLGDHFNPSVREVNIPKLNDGSCGFDLSRSKWDPYPWVSGVDKDSPAEKTGLKIGDCVLEVNSEDVLGQRIVDVANLVKSNPTNVLLLLWTTQIQEKCTPSSICCGPMPLSLEKLSATVQTILTALECPICLETIPPPVSQCMNGHLVCLKCRQRAEKCPICRERYSAGRSLIAEHVYNSIVDTFHLKEDGKLREKLFGAKCKRRSPTLMDNSKNIQSHTHKFLARIMGKSSSLDNLSTHKNIDISESSMISTKPLSLSVNEIYRDNKSVSHSRSPSPNRPTPDLGSQVNLGTRRPLTNNNSESCNNLFIAIPEDNKFHCPCINQCELLKPSNIIDHISNKHQIPITIIGLHTLNLSLPPRQPLDNSLFILKMGNKRFWLRIEDHNGGYAIGATIEANESESRNFYLEAKIFNNGNEKLVSKEMISRTSISSLEEQCFLESFHRKCIVFTNKSIQTTLDSKVDLMLTTTIKLLSDT